MISLTIMKRPAHLSGIQPKLPNFNVKLTSSQKRNPKGHAVDSDDDFGGLQDDDLLSPPPKATTKGKFRDNDVNSFSPVNTYNRLLEHPEKYIAVDALLDSEDDPTASIPVKPKQKGLRTKAPAQKVQSAATESGAKWKASTPCSTASTESTPSTGCEENGLPDFIAKKWTLIVLPTLYHRFFTSEETFISFAKGSSTLQDHVINILNVSLPNHTYQFTRKSTIMTMVCNIQLVPHYLQLISLCNAQAYNRCTKKRSVFGIHTIAVVVTLTRSSSSPDMLDTPNVLPVMSTGQLSHTGLPCGHRRRQKVSLRASLDIR
jgi:hypothetical protein